MPGGVVVGLKRWLGPTATFCSAVIDMLRQRFITLMQKLTSLKINDSLDVPIVILIDCSFHADQPSVLVAFLHANVCVESQLLCAR